MDKEDIEANDSFEKGVERFEKESTKGFKKLREYFFSLIRQKNFRKDILKLRSKYGIPENGFPDFRYKGEFDVPDQWERKNSYDFKGLQDDLNALRLKYHLYDRSWTDDLWSYLFGTEPDPRGHLFTRDYDLFYLTTEPHKETRPADAEDGYEDIYESLDRDISMEFPIALRISPLASQRDILDFVKTNWKKIHNLQKSFVPTNVLKARKKKFLIQQRDKFIWEHRNLPYKEIHAKVREKFKELLSDRSLPDEGAIGKIISTEREKWE